MKKGIFAKLGAVACVLTLVTTSLVGGTFAKYTSETKTNASAVAAKWGVAFNDSTGTAITDKTTVNLVNTNDKAESKTGTIAPGSTGKIAINVVGTNSEVPFDYEITIGSMTNLPIKFYSDSAMGTEITTSLKNTAVIAAGASELVEIYWKWDDASTDAVDTGIGSDATEANRTGTADITMTATQHIDPASTPAN